MNPPDLEQTDRSTPQATQPWRPPVSRPGRGFWSLMIFSLVAVGGVAYLQFSRVDKARRTRGVPIASVQLPVLGNVPAFSLTERSGRTVSLSDLRGKVWVADFIFTSCGGPCPIMTNRMRGLQQTLRKQHIENVQTVSFTVDPQTDTPAILREYATMKQADPYDWWFLTGSEKDIYDLSVRGFKLGVEKEQETDQVSHSMRFILVDQKARIRGYYEVVMDSELEAPRGEVIDKPMAASTQQKILSDIRQLLKEEKR